MKFLACLVPPHASHVFSGTVAVHALMRAVAEEGRYVGKRSDWKYMLKDLELIWKDHAAHDAHAWKLLNEARQAFKGVPSPCVCSKCPLPDKHRGMCLVPTEGTEERGVRKQVESYKEARAKKEPRETLDPKEDAGALGNLDDIHDTPTDLEAFRLHMSLDVKLKGGMTVGVDTREPVMLRKKRIVYIPQCTRCHAVVPIDAVTNGSPGAVKRIRHNTKLAFAQHTCKPFIIT